MTFWFVLAMIKLGQILRLLIALPLVPLSWLRMWWWGCRESAKMLHAAAKATGENQAHDEFVLIFSEVMWDEVWQRPQELALRLAHEHVVLYVSPVQLHRYLFSLRERWQPLRIEGGGSCIVFSPLVLPGHYRVEGIYVLNTGILRALLRPWIAAARRVYAICNSPFAWPVFAHLFFRDDKRDLKLARLLYDVIDDFPSFPWALPFARRLESKFIEKADLVTTGTYELWHQHRQTRQDAEFIPCGVDFDLFNQPAGDKPSDLASLPEPIVGYIGSVSDRIDFQLLEKLASRLPTCSLVLVGPVRTSMPLPQAQNIHYLGLKSHAELPRYAQHFAVGLIPFLVNEATTKLNPVKTLEYLAAGIPVVSTELPDIVRFFSHTVLVAQDHEDFVAKVCEAIQYPDPELIRRGVAMAQDASWERMARRFANRLFTHEVAPEALDSNRSAGERA